MTAQNEHLHEKIARLEKDNTGLLKTLYHAESLRTSSEQDLYNVKNFLKQKGLLEELEAYLRQECVEGSVSGFMTYMGNRQRRTEDEYDSQGHRSLEEHRERMDAYKALKEDV